MYLTSQVKKAGCEPGSMYHLQKPERIGKQVTLPCSGEEHVSANILILLVSFKLLFIYLKDKAWWVGRDTERSSIHWSLLKWLQQPGLGQAKARNQESHLDLPWGCMSSSAWATLCFFSKPLAVSWIGSRAPGTPISIHKERLHLPTVPQCWPKALVLDQ